MVFAALGISLNRFVYAACITWSCMISSGVGAGHSINKIAIDGVLLDQVPAGSLHQWYGGVAGNCCDGGAASVGFLDVFFLKSTGLCPTRKTTKAARVKKQRTFL